MRCRSAKRAVSFKSSILYIEASMKDGVFSLKIYCGKPYELDDEETILIR